MEDLTFQTKNGENTYHVRDAFPFMPGGEAHRAFDNINKYCTVQQKEDLRNELETMAKECDKFCEQNAKISPGECRSMRARAKRLRDNIARLK